MLVALVECDDDVVALVECDDDVVALVECEVRPAHELREMWDLQEREGVGA